MFDGRLVLKNAKATDRVCCVCTPPVRHPVLALVQLEFLSDTGRTDDASKLAGGAEDSLGTSADLLGLSTEELTGALLTRPLQVAREKFVKPNKVGEAQSARDALAKDVYLGIFNYLLKKINEATRYVCHAILLRVRTYCCRCSVPEVCQAAAVLSCTKTATHLLYACVAMSVKCIRHPTTIE